MASTDSDPLADSARRELLGNILPFWRKHAVDRQHGGFVAELSNTREPKPDAGKGLILNARILWTFSAAWKLTGAAVDRELAERAYNYLQTYFRDPEFGGYFWELDAQGRPLNRTKKIYGQAFAIYALTEFHNACGHNAALDSAIALFKLIERFSRDAAHGGYIEALADDWQPCEDVRLSEKDLNEKKSMNNHLHLLEAYTNLLRVWPDRLLQQRLRELVEIFREHILDSSWTHLNHFFDDAWSPRSESYTYGHDIEGSWLLWEAGSVLDGADLLASLRPTVIGIARKVLEEGTDKDGGLFYEGREGQVIRTVKEWWPQAEAVVGFLNAWELTRDATFLTAARGCWRFIQEKIVDHTNGEWFWAVSCEGEPDPALPKISMWKCPYHNSRACLEIINRLAPPALSKHEHDTGIV